MKTTKRKALEQAGWKVGSAEEFLELTDAEAMLVHIKFALASQVKERRTEQNLTQADLAKLLGSSQSRVAKLEAADRSVSMELLFRSLATLGATREEIGKAVAANPKSAVSKRKKVQS